MIDARRSCTLPAGSRAARGVPRRATRHGDGTASTAAHAHALGRRRARRANPTEGLPQSRFVRPCGGQDRIAARPTRKRQRPPRCKLEHELTAALFSAARRLARRRGADFRPFGPGGFAGRSRPLGRGAFPCRFLRVHRECLGGGGAMALALKCACHGTRSFGGRGGLFRFRSRATCGLFFRGGGFALRRDVDTGFAGLRQPDRNRLRRGPSAMFAFTDVFNFFADKFAGLRARRFALAFVAFGAFNNGFFRHDVLPWVRNPEMRQRPIHRPSACRGRSRSRAMRKAAGSGGSCRRSCAGRSMFCRSDARFTRPRHLLNVVRSASGTRRARFRLTRKTADRRCRSTSPACSAHRLAGSVEHCCCARTR